MTSHEHIAAAIDQLELAKVHLATADKASGAAQFMAQKNALQQLDAARTNCWSAEASLERAIMADGGGSTKEVAVVAEAANPT